jgi:hypothetical protein
MARYGDLLARSHRGRIGPPTASTTTIKALPVDHESRIDGATTLVLSDSSLWAFDADSSAGASATVLVPDAGTGRFLKLLEAQEATVGQVNVPLTSFVDADGDPLVKFSTGASTVPGFNLADSEAFGIRWNDHATPDPILTQVTMPQDLDETADVVVHILASKTGATLADAVTFDVTAFFHTVGALHDADADAGGTTDAMTGDAAAKTVQEVTVAIDAGDVPAPPASLSLTIQPTDDLLDADDVIVEAVWLEYSRAVVTV